jgi:thiol-disulfide isomerase/thioredoxin
MQQAPALATALLLVLGLATPAVALELELREPVAVPSALIQDLAGEPVDLKDALATGKVVVLNFWATWCAPCKQEMPTLAALDAAFAERPLEVLTVAMDRAGPDSLRRFMAEVGAADLPILHDPKMAVSVPYGITGLPITLVVDGGGSEVFRHAGFADWSAPSVVAFLEELLDATD